MLDVNRRQDTHECVDTAFALAIARAQQQESGEVRSPRWSPEASPSSRVQRRQAERTRGGLSLDVVTGVVYGSC